MDSEKLKQRVLDQHLEEFDLHREMAAHMQEKVHKHIGAEAMKNVIVVPRERWVNGNN